MISKITQKNAALSDHARSLRKLLLSTRRRAKGFAKIYKRLGKRVPGMGLASKIHNSNFREKRRKCTRMQSVSRLFCPFLNPTT